MSLMKCLWLHGSDASEDIEDLLLPGCGDRGVEEEFMHSDKIDLK